MVICSGNNTNRKNKEKERHKMTENKIKPLMMTHMAMLA